MIVDMTWDDGIWRHKHQLDCCKAPNFSRYVPLLRAQTAWLVAAPSSETFSLYDQYWPLKKSLCSQRQGPSKDAMAGITEDIDL
jgi:hypothetical protein